MGILYSTELCVRTFPRDRNPVPTYSFRSSATPPRRNCLRACNAWEAIHPRAGNHDAKLRDGGHQRDEWRESCARGDLQAGGLPGPEIPATNDRDEPKTIRALVKLHRREACCRFREHLETSRSATMALTCPDGVSAHQLYVAF